METKIHTTIRQDFPLSQNTLHQCEQLRLERIRQQRVRMENMKDVIDQYSSIIAELENKNKMLAMDNQRYSKYQELYNQTLVENRELATNYRWVQSELSREVKLRESLELTINGLRGGHAVSGSYQDGYMEAWTSREKDYETLIALYEELKNQVYSLSKQNLSLREVIENQSKLHYQSGQLERKVESLNFSQSQSQSQGHKHKQNHKTTCPKSKKQLPQALSKEKKQISIKTETYRHEEMERKTKKSERAMEEKENHQRVKNMKKQLKKQYQLIEKYREAEAQQLQLIEMLKNQNSKVCLCHSHGVSSKKILGSKNGLTSNKYN